MRQKAHRRSRTISTSVAAAAALLLGGGGLALVNVNASAGDAGAGNAAQPQSVSRSATVDCPDVADRLSDVPARVRGSVDRDLARLDSQVADAYQQLTGTSGSDGGPAPSESVMRSLEEQRRSTIDRITQGLGRDAQGSRGLNSLARCTVRDADRGSGRGEDRRGRGSRGHHRGHIQGRGGDQHRGRDHGRGGDRGRGGNQGGGGGAQQPPTGPSADDFVDITRVRPNVREPGQRRGASRGTFITNCGRNENGKFNSDNVIAAPGVSNGAHHTHDYVGNQDTTAFSTDDSLAAGATTCRNQQDLSTYYWPVIRVRNGQQERDANAPGGGQDGNIGQIQSPASVSLQFRGSPVGKVTTMPRFLRIITGDAKSFTNGDANANASWSCTGFENRQLTDKYPLCPRGSRVVRTFRFQSCWDGQNTDSANHRTHVAFADRKGRCPTGFRAIPQLVQKVTYRLPRGPVFAVDSFPEQLHKPITDHSDFINVMTDTLMRKAVNCINTGRVCR